MGQPASGRVANLWRSARLSLVILSIFRLVAPVRAAELDGVAGRHIESSIGAVGMQHVWDKHSTGFTNSNPEHNDCQAWDSKGTYDFSHQAGLTLSWYDESRNTSFIFQMCFGLAQIYGLDITQTNYTELANHESTVLGYFKSAIIVRNTSGSDYDLRTLNTWGDALYMVHNLEHGSQGPPCNAPYDRVKNREEAYPFGDRSPLAAGRRAFVTQLCSDCIPGTSDCYPCPGNTACLPNSTAMTIAPFTGNTLVSTTHSEYACVCSTTDQLTADGLELLGSVAGCVEVTTIATYCPEEVATYSLVKRFLFGLTPLAFIVIGICVSYIKFLLKGNVESIRALGGAVMAYDWVLKRFRMMGCCKRDKFACDVDVHPMVLRKRMEKLGDALGFKPLPTIANLQNALELRALSRVMMNNSVTERAAHDVSFSEVVGLKDEARKQWLLTEWEESKDGVDLERNPLSSQTGK